jgi:hypothetical protein
LATQPETADLDTLLREWGLTHSTQERFWVIAIDNLTQLKTVTEVARGGFRNVLVHVPTVLAAVVAAYTDRFYVAHNHPSGPVTPTEEDLSLTALIMDGANAAGLHFEDHIITGPEGWFSFYSEGLITRAEATSVAVPHRWSRPTPPEPGPRRRELQRRDLRLYLPGNPSHWFASTGRGIKYLSLCGVDRRNKSYRPKRGPRVAQCELCKGAGGVAIPGQVRRREVAIRQRASSKH